MIIKRNDVQNLRIVRKLLKSYLYDYVYYFHDKLTVEIFNKVLFFSDYI